MKSKKGSTTTTTLRTDEIRLPAGADPGACDEALIAELVANIRVLGLVNPLTVRSTAEGHVLVAGLHRFVAAQKLGLTEVPVRVVVTNDRKARAITLAENLVRAHRPALQSAALKELHELLSDGDRLDAEDGAPRTGARPGTITATAAVAGVSRSAASRALKRARVAAPEVAEAEAAGKLAPTAVDELTRLEPEQQRKVLPIALGRSRDEVRSVVNAELGSSAAKPIRQAISKFMFAVNQDAVSALPPADRRIVLEELGAAIERASGVVSRLKVPKVA